MGTKHVIAYVMHEAERDLAAQQIENAQVTDSYVIGDIDEDRVEELEQAGLVVDELPPAGPAHDQRHGAGHHVGRERRPGMAARRRR